MKYHGEWKSHEDVVGTYGANAPTDAEIVYASYNCESYNGWALVVFWRDGQLYENNDSHCSCNGLENWEPEATSVDALLIRQGWPGLADAVKAAAGQ